MMPFNWLIDPKNHTIEPKIMTLFFVQLEL